MAPQTKQKIPPRIQKIIKNNAAIIPTIVAALNAKFGVRNLKGLQGRGVIRDITEVVRTVLAGVGLLTVATVAFGVWYVKNLSTQRLVLDFANSQMGRGINIPKKYREFVEKHRDKAIKIMRAIDRLIMGRGVDTQSGGKMNDKTKSTIKKVLVGIGIAGVAALAFAVWYFKIRQTEPDVAEQLLPRNEKDEPIFQPSQYMEDVGGIRVRTVVTPQQKLTEYNRRKRELAAQQLAAQEAKLDGKRDRFIQKMNKMMDDGTVGKWHDPMSKFLHHLRRDSADDMSPRERDMYNRYMDIKRSYEPKRKVYADGSVDLLVGKGKKKKRKKKTGEWRYDRPWWYTGAGDGNKRKKYPKGKGTRVQVYNGVATMTGGGLRKADLIKKNGKIYSKKEWARYGKR